MSECVQQCLYQSTHIKPTDLIKYFGNLPTTTLHNYNDIMRIPLIYQEFPSMHVAVPFSLSILVLFIYLKIKKKMIINACNMSWESP